MSGKFRSTGSRFFNYLITEEELDLNPSLLALLCLLDYGLFDTVQKESVCKTLVKYSIDKSLKMAVIDA